MAALCGSDAEGCGKASRIGQFPPGNLVEVTYEELERAPLRELRRIYERLGLPGFADAETMFRAYIESVRGYRRNEFTLDADIIAKVNEHWRFAFDEWGYEVR